MYSLKTSILFCGSVFIKVTESESEVQNDLINTD